MNLKHKYNNYIYTHMYLLQLSSLHYLCDLSTAATSKGRLPTYGEQDIKQFHHEYHLI